MAVSAKSLESDLTVRQATDPSAAPVQCQELFRFRFDPAASTDCPDGIFQIHIESIGPQAPDEIWLTSGAVTHSVVGQFRIAQCADFLAAHVAIDLPEGADFGDLTTQIYRELLQLTHERGYPSLARVWNYFPGINAGEGDREMYRQFTAGRALAFGEFAYQGEALPAGTAIGTDAGTPFTISAIATRDRCRMVENPRQTSAYRYPREYGLRSPSFSRAVVIAAPGGFRILISGTASIVGHQSMHLDDASRQAAETLRNLDELIRQARQETQAAEGADGMPINGSLRVYVRHPEQVSEIEAALRSALGDDRSLVFLRGDICRRELLLEIEAAGGI